MTAIERALTYLFNNREAAAGDVGNAVWPDRDVRAGRGVATGGGGDYAAQMLLGRLKKAGLVEHAPSEGSSRWRLTRKGMDAVHEINPTMTTTKLEEKFHSCPECGAPWHLHWVYVMEGGEKKRRYNTCSLTREQLEEKFL
jgi:hypothetical protein